MYKEMTKPSKMLRDYASSLVSRDVEWVGEQLRVDRVQLPEHLPDLVVAQGGRVGRVDDEDELDPGVGHVPVHLLLLRGEEGAEVQVTALGIAGKSHYMTDTEI